MGDPMNDTKRFREEI